MIRYKNFEFEDTGHGLDLVRYTYNSEKEALQTVIIPSEVAGKPVIHVAGEAFYENGTFVEKLVVPGTVRRVGRRAFELCMNLKELVLEEGVLELGEDFLFGTQLEELNIPASLRLISRPEEVLSHINVAAGNKYYMSDGYGFYRIQSDGSLIFVAADPIDEREEYEILPGTTRIRRGSLDGREFLKKLILPASIEKIDKGALANAKDGNTKIRGITDIRVADANPTFFTEGQALYERGEDGLILVRYFGNAKEYHISDEVTDVGPLALMKCPAERIIFPPSIRKICKGALDKCGAVEIVFLQKGQEIKPDNKNNNPISGETRVRFALHNDFMRTQHLACFGNGGKVFDFAEYDRMLDYGYLDEDRIEMILLRLKYPAGLIKEMREQYEGKLIEKLEEVLKNLSAAGNFRALKLMTESGLLDEENTGRAIEIFGEIQDEEMKATIMEYKNRVFGRTEDDFEL